MSDDMVTERLAPTERVIAERYVLHTEIGRGGMGVVWRAEDRIIGRPVAVKEMRLSEGVTAGERAELLQSPVALAFDERGRMYVAENRGYPMGPSPGQPPAGRIALLEDTDGDGRMDRRTEFVQGLTFPNGVMPWRGGLIVTCAPDVLFVRDTDGDGKADERRVLFTGFATTGSTQLRVSHPSLSSDNWIYLTSGLTGGKVISLCPQNC